MADDAGPHDRVGTVAGTEGGTTIETTTCRCNVLNHLMGDAAAEYARRHLDVTREFNGRVTTYRCPDTGITWVEERAPTAYDDSTRRLRRLER